MLFGINENRWFRILGRFCDYCLFYLIAGAITLSLPYFYVPFFYYFLALATPLLWAPVEAMLLNKWATTPGKFLFGFSVHKGKKENLSYQEALRWSLGLKEDLANVEQKPLSVKRKLYALLTSATFMIAALCGNALALWTMGLDKGDLTGWVQYTSEEAGFTVAFPKDPEAASKKLVIQESGKVLDYKEVTSKESRRVIYSVSHIKLPGKWRLASNTTLLKGVLELLVTHAEGAELITKQFATHSTGYRVLDYRMKQGNDEMQGRLIVMAGILYKLTVAYPPSHGDDSQIAAFFNSFALS